MSLAWLKTHARDELAISLPADAGEILGGRASDDPGRGRRGERPDDPAAGPDTASAAADTTSAARTPPWKVTVAEVAVDDLSFAFTDSTTTPPFVDRDRSARSHATESELGAGRRIRSRRRCHDREDGKAHRRRRCRRASRRSARVKAALSDFPLPIFQPYITPLAHLEIVSGTVGATGDIEISDVKPGTIPRVVFKGVGGIEELRHEGHETERELSSAGDRST